MLSKKRRSNDKICVSMDQSYFEKFGVILKKLGMSKVDWIRQKIDQDIALSGVFETIKEEIIEEVRTGKRPSGIKMKWSIP